MAEAPTAADEAPTTVNAAPAADAHSSTPLPSHLGVRQVPEVQGILDRLLLFLDYQGRPHVTAEALIQVGVREGVGGWVGGGGGEGWGGREQGLLLLLGCQGLPHATAEVLEQVSTRLGGQGACRGWWKAGCSRRRASACLPACPPKLARLHRGVSPTVVLPHGAL